MQAYQRVNIGSQISPVEGLVSKNASIEEFYNAEDFLYFLSSEKKSQVSFLKHIIKTHQITKLIDYCIFPKKILADKSRSDSYDNRCKYAYFSIAVFDILKQNIVQHDTNKYLGYIFTYLDQKSEELESTQSSYFDQILSSIFTKKHVLSWMLVKENQHQMAKFVSHVSIQPIAQLIQDCLCSPEESDQKMQLLKMLIQKFDSETESDSEAIENISSIFINLMKAIEDDGDNYLQPYAKFIFKEAHLDIFFKKMASCGDSYNIFYTVQIIIEITRNFQAGELGPYFAKQIDVLLKIISTPTQAQQIQTSYGEQISHFGQGRIKTLELFLHFILQYDFDKVLMKKIASTDFFEIVFDLFFTHTWNTKLSFLVEGIIVQAIEMDNEDINVALIEKVDIVKKIVKNYRKSEIFVEYGGKQYKKGNVGCFTKIARELDEQESNSYIQKHLKNNEKWMTFKENKLKDLTKREELQWEEKLTKFTMMPKLEYMWSSYMDTSMPRGTQNKLGRSGDMGDVMERSMKRSKGKNTAQQLKMSKVKRSEVIISNANDPKELMIHTALYGCGTNDCNNPFCYNNSEFQKKNKNIGEFDVTKITSPDNIRRYIPCLVIQRQLNNKYGRPKLVFDTLHKTFGSQVVLKFENTAMDKNSMLLKTIPENSSDKSLIKSTTLIVSNDQFKDSRWALEVIENDWVQIRNMQNGYLLRAGRDKISGNFMTVGTGNHEIDGREENYQGGQHINEVGKDLPSKWILKGVGGDRFTLQNAFHKSFLTGINNKLTNSRDFDVGLGNKADEKASVFRIIYI